MGAMKTLDDIQNELGQRVFPCDCGDHRHGLIIGSDHGEIYLQIAYFPQSWRERLSHIYHVLRWGVASLDQDMMVVRSENVEALCDVLVKAGQSENGGWS